MSAQLKKAQQTARQYFKLSLVDGVISQERVSGVLQYLEKNPPSNLLLVLKCYQRLVAAELAKSVAVVEHAGTVDNSVLKGIAAAFTKHYKRAISAVSSPRPSLIAGLRVKIGDDVYESSVAGRLRALAEATR